MAGQEVAQGGFWSGVNPTVKNTLVIGTAVLLLGGISLYVGGRVIRRRRSQSILKNALYDKSLASLVEKIDVALTGAGTDEQKVYEAFSDIQTQEQAGKIIKMYKDAYGETLDEALRSDLESEELQTVKNIISGKPRKKGDAPSYGLLEDWKRRLRAAAGSWSTDEDAIYAVLWEVPDYNGYTVLSKAIASEKLAGYESLTEYLKGQLDEEEQEQAKYIINRKKNGAEKVADA
ncbi:MAG: hypothetical protein AB1458_12035 [Bacteroidota bacterium]